MWLSILGLYNAAPDIFDDFSLPTQISGLKDEIIEQLLMECAEFEVIYPNPAIMKAAIGSWSSLRLHTWQRIADALYKNYDPFINFTRDERRERLETRDLAGSEDITSSGADNYNNIQDARTRSGNATTTNSATAFDSNNFANATKQAYTDGETDTNIRTGSIGRSGTSSTESTDTGTIGTVETFHSQGDSALFTPTDIAKKETEMRLANDIIHLIMMEFKTRFCIMVY